MSGGPGQKGKDMRKFTVFYDQRNRINYQVLAEDKSRAILKANKIYKKNMIISDVDVQEGWLVESEGEDK